MITILLLDEPEGVKAIDISTPQQHQAVALSIVKERYKMGNYKQPGNEPIPPILSYIQVKELPAGEFRNFGFTKWAHYREKLNKWKAEKEAWDHIKQCINDEDGEKAISILNERKEQQKERFSILKVYDKYQ